MKPMGKKQFIRHQWGCRIVVDLSHRKAALEAYSDLAPRMRDLRASGATLQAIANTLNTEGHTTRRGQPWNPTQVDRVLKLVR